jgi:hypothetical protein
MKRTTLLIGGIAVLAGAAAYLLFAGRKQAVAELTGEDESGHAKGEKMLRRALHKAKVATT